MKASPLLMTEMEQALDEIITLIEADIPANPSSPENQRHERQYARLMADYFKALEQAFPYDKLADIYYKYATIESTRLREAGPIGDAGDIIDPILRAFQPRFLADIAAQHVSVYLAGSAQIVSWGKTKLEGKPILYEGPPVQKAINYAQKHCAQLVTRMDDETKTRLAQVVSDGIKNKRGVDGLARDIRKEFQDMTTYRSKLIAKSETRDALFHSSQDTFETMGITGKEWVLGSGGLGGNCPDCLANAAVGVIPVDQEFPIPQYEIHPGCT